MTTRKEIDLADKLARRRARVATVFAVIFVTTQGFSFGDPTGRPATIHLAAWMVWAVVLLFLLMVGGGLWRGASVRSLMNDESTAEHRRRALVTGFWCMLAMCGVLFAISYHDDVTIREGVRLIISVGVSTALLRFGALEQRSLRHG